MIDGSSSLSSLPSITIRTSTLIAFRVIMEEFLGYLSRATEIPSTRILQKGIPRSFPSREFLTDIALHMSYVVPTTSIIISLCSTYTTVVILTIPPTIGIPFSM